MNVIVNIMLGLILGMLVNVNQNVKSIKNDTIEIKKVLNEQSK